MQCYVRDFGRARLAVCEVRTAEGYWITVTEVLHEPPTAALWARLGQALGSSAEIVEAQ